MSNRARVALWAGVMVALLGVSHASVACEMFHLKRVRNPLPTPVVPPGSNSLCWTGCPLQIEGEPDTGKGRWIIRKEAGVNSIQGIWIVEKNLNTGQVFYGVTERSDRVCPEPVEVTALINAGAINMMTFGCNAPDYKLKFVDPMVCADQTLNCPTSARRSVKVFHDFDAIDDLGRGIDVVRDGVTFSHSATASPSIFFEKCCGNVSDFGTPGDPFDLDTFAVIRTPGGQCFTQKLREGARNSGDPLPDPSGSDDCAP